MNDIGWKLFKCENYLAVTFFLLFFLTLGSFMRLVLNKIYVQKAFFDICLHLQILFYDIF